MADARAFDPDRPIQSIEEDRLGIAPFADHLARAIANWIGKESLILGACGPWGCGKSSLRALSMARLKELPRAPRVVQFDPWLYGEPEALARAFFEEVGRALAPPDPGGRGDPNAENRLKRWRWLQTLLSLSGTFAQAAGVAVAAQSGSPEAAALGSGAGSALETAAKAISSGADGLEKSRAVITQSVAQLREEIRADLEKLTPPILVVIDELDRLQPSQTALMFALMRAVADFPNLHYLLFFQRDAVAQSLSVALGVDGERYLEKVVQVFVEVPKPSANQLRALLLASTLELLKSFDIDGVEASELEHAIVGVLPWIRTPRAVKRLLNALRFWLSAFGDEPRTPIDPLDLIRLEVLRLFEPAVHAELPALRAQLLNDPLEPVTTFERAEARTRLQQLAKKQSETLALLEAVFPNVAEESLSERDATKLAREYADNDIKPTRQMREALGERARPGAARTHAGFHRYFQCGAAQTDTGIEATVRLVRAFASQGGSREQAMGALKSALEQGMIQAVLAELVIAGGRTPSEARNTLVLLCDIWNGTTERVGHEVSECAKRLLESLHDGEKLDALKAMASEACDVSFPLLVLAAYDGMDGSLFLVGSMREVQSTLLWRIAKDGWNPARLPKFAQAYWQKQIDADK